LHAPASQTSPEPQLVPLAAVFQLVVEVPGRQVWHESNGLAAPLA
jgi:hypothetical protein